MARDVRIDQASRAVVLGWKSSEDGLLLRVHGETDEIRLVCRCGRSHWIVHEQQDTEHARLVLVCHHCGDRGTLEMEGVRTAAR
jgi:hypothetical protein